MSLIESTENANENTASLQFCTNRLIPEELEAEILASISEWWTEQAAGV